MTMGVVALRGLYDCNGRLAAWRTYVYVLMARDGDGPMYVKVGRSDNPIKRISNVQVGCPFRIVKAGMVKCLTIEQASSIERELHLLLQDHWSSGEWFRFDWKDTEQRQKLQSMMEVAFAGVPQWVFEEIDLERAARELRALVSERQRRSRENRRHRGR